MIFYLHGAQKHSDLEGTLPIRGGGLLHHVQRLLMNPPTGSSLPSAAAYVFIGHLGPKRPRLHI